VGDLTGEVLRKRLRAIDDQLERLGIVLVETWPARSCPSGMARGRRTLVMPDTKHPGRDAAPCSTRSWV